MNATEITAATGGIAAFATAGINLIRKNRAIVNKVKDLDERIKGVDTRLKKVEDLSNSGAIHAREIEVRTKAIEKGFEVLSEKVDRHFEATMNVLLEIRGDIK